MARMLDPHASSSNGRTKCPMYSPLRRTDSRRAHWSRYYSPDYADGFALECRAAKKVLKEKGVNQLPNANVLQKIVEAAQAGVTVTISYVGTDGQTTHRETEPYDIKNNKYWGYDVEKNGIRQFDLSRVNSAVATKNTYNPRWTVNIK